jgi:hypothetical protein
MEPNYQKMYLADLKLLAKTRRIKLYYIKTKDELIELLKMPELPLAMRIEKMTIHQLRAEAKKRGMTGYFSLRRDALVTLLFPQDVDEATPNKNEEDQGETNKHHQPEEHDTKEIGV